MSPHSEKQKFTSKKNFILDFPFKNEISQLLGDTESRFNSFLIKKLQRKKNKNFQLRMVIDTMVWCKCVFKNGDEFIKSWKILSSQ